MDSRENRVSLAAKGVPTLKWLVSFLENEETEVPSLAEILISTRGTFKIYCPIRHVGESRGNFREFDPLREYSRGGD